MGGTQDEDKKRQHREGKKRGLGIGRGQGETGMRLEVFQSVLCSPLENISYILKTSMVK